MSPASYRAAPPRVGLLTIRSLAWTPKPGHSASWDDPRSRLVMPRPFLALMRLSIAERDGLVGRRGGGGGARASRRASAKRRSAARRFCNCDRCSSAVIDKVPSTRRADSRFRARALRWSGMLAEPAISNVTVARESVVLTLCPPGPDERVNFHSSSAAGIVTADVTTRSSLISRV